MRVQEGVDEERGHGVDQQAGDDMLQDVTPDARVEDEHGATLTPLITTLAPVPLSFLSMVTWYADGLFPPRHSMRVRRHRSTQRPGGTVRATASWVSAQPNPPGHP